MLKLKRKVGSYSDLGEPTHITDSYERFNCPYCIELRDKEDTDAKLYFNIKKGLGFCFKCDSIVSDDRSPSLPRLGEALIELIENRYKIGHNKTESTRYTLADWTYSITEKPDVHEYLNNRGITDETIKQYGLRACESPVDGVVVPNTLFNNLETNFFQIRDIDSGAWIKYRNPTGIKPLYGIGFIKDQKKAFVGEGVFSSLACLRYGKNFATLATYGKSVKKTDIPTFRKLPIEEYYLIYDGGEFWSIVKSAQTLSACGKPVYMVFLPYKKDPNELSKVLLKTSINNYSIKYSSLVTTTLIKKYNKGIDYKDRWERMRYYVRKLNYV